LRNIETAVIEAESLYGYSIVCLFHYIENFESLSFERFHNRFGHKIEKSSLWYMRWYRKSKPLIEEWELLIEKIISEVIQGNSKPNPDNEYELDNLLNRAISLHNQITKSGTKH
jgi:hypothetical protein